MNKSKLVTVAVTALLVIVFYDKIAGLPLVDKIPRL